MTISKADMLILQRYSSLVTEKPLRDRFMHLLTSEYERATRMILAITEQSEILEKNPTLQSYLKTRDRYLDPLNYIQVDLLKRYRATDSSDPERQKLIRAIQVSINGIASGMKNTG